MSETNIENRKKLMNSHSTGKKSFALICKTLEKEKESVSFKDFFVAARARKPNRSYKDLNENTLSKIAEMEEIETHYSRADGQSGQSVDTFQSSWVLNIRFV